MTTLQSNFVETAAGVPATPGGPGSPGAFSVHDASRARRRTAVWNGCARAVIWGTSIVAVALWVSGQGIQSVLGFDAETLNSVSRLAGLVSANLLLYQVLLMARIPLFEKGFGRDTITRFHRIVGIWSVVLLVVHAVLIWLGYAIQDGVGLFAQASDLLWNYPGMLIAVIGSLLVLGVAVSSARRSRRRVRYESWHLLHLYAYLGVGMAVPHMLWTGADFLDSPAATVYWWGLWIVTVISVVFFRVLRPLWRGARAGLRVVQVRPDGNSAVAVRVQGRGSESSRPRQGSFSCGAFSTGLAGAGATRSRLRRLPRTQRWSCRLASSVTAPAALPAFDRGLASWWRVPSVCLPMISVVIRASSCWVPARASRRWCRSLRQATGCRVKPCW
ncbi:ferric reductase-like transmembrane domain-containing protein [Leucobacter insecticola]|uniref:ferric reductase-like transmembrane domain-containing protein n=1 Tax=Leucobacter insecticola TaxID=2714934 RepID=UPI001FCB6E1C|nr:ferric reductase-like transmembrane domain-containing protein [Leucobacter insecticola]